MYKYHFTIVSMRYNGFDIYQMPFYYGTGQKQYLTGEVG